jgi:hypothetical protein
MSNIRPLDDDDTRIRSQPACQLAVTNVNRIDPRRAALQETICEPARTRAEIRGDETARLNAKGAKRMIKLFAAAAHESWRSSKGQFVAVADTGASPRDRQPIDEYVGGHDQSLGARSILGKSALHDRFIQAPPDACVPRPPAGLFIRQPGP